MPLNSPVAAPCYVAGGCGMACHRICRNVRHIGILHLVPILTISPQSTCDSAPACEILSKSDHPQQKNDVMSIFKMADLSHLGFYGSNICFFEQPMYDIVNRHHSWKLLSFDKISFFCILATDRQTIRRNFKLGSRDPGHAHFGGILSFVG